jgi:hypothetical protein
MAMGCEKGFVRLYKSPCLGRATVNFNVNVGDQPVSAIDVSPDEQWIVTTSPYSIAVFNVLAKSTGKLAFVAQMRGDKEPVTILAPKAADLQRIAAGNGGELPPFTSAKFETKGGKVAAIVASMGNAILCWDFRAIENGRIPAYSITFLQMEHVVDDQPLEATADVLYIAPNQFSCAERKRRNQW